MRQLDAPSKSQLYDDETYWITEQGEQSGKNETEHGLLLTEIPPGTQAV